MMSREEYPEVYQIVMKDVYVDDCLSGEDSKEIATERADQLDIVLGRGSFKLKRITMTGSNPHKDLSVDGKTINVAGLIWEPKKDLISLDIKDLNFAKKYRGKTVKILSTVPEKLTRRHCTSKVAGIYDLTGLFTPIIATMKMDIHELVTRKLNWDDQIPDCLRNAWISHFELMSEIKNIRFNRAVVPEDAINCDVNTLSFGDASKKLVCVAIYVRYKLKSGAYSCQLIFGRSRLVPDNMSQSRAELYAALINVHVSDSKFTDSQISLHWIWNENKTLKQWVRNRVIEIRRYTEIKDWRYIQSEDMITLNDVNANSTWVNGHMWMKLDNKEFPAKTIDEVKLNNQDIVEVRKESNFEFDNLSFVTRHVPDDVQERYQLSNYLIDPNRYRYKKVIRIMAFVLKFIHNLKRKSSSKTEVKLIAVHEVSLTEENLKAAEMYYFKKSTIEVKHFLKPNQYEKLSIEKDGVLFYKGRILPTEKISITGRLTEAMKDLSADAFCVPVVEKHSPLAYSIINDIHWYSDTVKHSGIESVWRCVKKGLYY